MGLITLSNSGSIEISTGSTAIAVEEFEHETQRHTLLTDNGETDFIPVQTIDLLIDFLTKISNHTPPEGIGTEIVEAMKKEYFRGHGLGVEAGAIYQNDPTTIDNGNYPYQKFLGHESDISINMDIWSGASPRNFLKMHSHPKVEAGVPSGMNPAFVGGDVINVGSIAGIVIGHRCISIYAYPTVVAVYGWVGEEYGRRLGKFINWSEYEGKGIKSHKYYIVKDDDTRIDYDEQDNVI